MKSSGLRTSPDTRSPLHDVEARARWLEERCRQLVNTSRSAFVAFDTDGSVLDWNDEAERRFGWARDEIVGRSVLDTVFPPPFSLSDLAGVRPNPAGPGAPVRGRQRQVRARHRSGDAFDVELHLWATSGGASHTFNAFAYEIVAPDPPGKSSCQMGAIIESSGEAISRCSRRRGSPSPC